MEGTLYPAQIFRYLASGLVAGMIIGCWVILPWYVGAALVVAAGLAAWRSTLFGRRWLLVLVGLGLAGLRAVALPVAPAAQVFSGPQEFVAQIVEPPRQQEKVVRYQVKADNGWLVLLVAKPEPAFAYGERLRVKCKNLEPVTFKATISQSIFRQCAFPELASLAQAQPSLRRSLLILRQQTGNKIRTVLPEPQATLATGMLWGDDAGLPKELVAAFRRTGTSHLLAVSGYNVMVVTEVLFWILLALGLWRRTGSVVVLLVVALFVLFTGAEPAVVRAGVMGSLVIAGRLLARRPDRLNLLLGTAAVMLLIAPALVRNLGFQLSFAAMAGLLFLAPLLNERLRFIPAIWGLRASAAQTLAATLATMPIILLRLGQLSLITPLANLLITPVVVLVFIFGLATLVLSFASTWLAAPAAWVLSAVLTYVIAVVAGLARLPWTAAVVSLVVWLAVVLFYLVLGWWLKPKVKSS